MAAQARLGGTSLTKAYRVVAETAPTDPCEWPKGKLKKRNRPDHTQSGSTILCSCSLSIASRPITDRRQGSPKSPKPPRPPESRALLCQWYLRGAPNCFHS